jgi:hypothetical protein
MPIALPWRRHCARSKKRSKPSSVSAATNTPLPAIILSGAWRRAKANLASTTPAELTATQSALATQFSEKFKGRIQEFVNLATEAQSSFNELLGDATAKVAETIKKAS